MSTPTPTDPREEAISNIRARANPLQLQANLDEANALSARLDAEVRDIAHRLSESRVEVHEARATNTKLAAEIAELKSTVQQCCESINHHIELEATLRAELEAARKENEDLRSDVQFEKSNYHSATNEIDRLNGEIAERDKDYEAAMREVDTALAAKDAAEKKRDAAREVLRQIATLDCGCVPCTGQCRTGRAAEIELESRMELALAALTPAPTQEPPAGVSPWQPIETAPTDGKIQIMIAEFRDGELIDIDFDAVLEQESESWEMPQTYWVWKSAHGRVENPTHWQPIIPPAGGVTISNETVGIIPTATTLTEASPDVSTLGAEAASHPSNSPANIPSVGRGELLPFNLSDALAGKTVVTRDGRKVSRIAKREGGYTFSVSAFIEFRGINLFTAEGRVNTCDCSSCDNNLDLFMLPPEGSGA